jgi:hypothetical protein
MNAEECRSFIDSVLNADLPPAHPLKRENWAGFAFDRNWHEDLAPSSIWEALFGAHVATNGDLNPLAYVDADGRQVVDEMAVASLEELRKRLDGGLAFETLFFVLCPNKNWLVRVDYDVTLFCGTSLFMKDVAARAGGLDEIRNAMILDFYGGGVIEEYTNRLIRPLR